MLVDITMTSHASHLVVRFSGFRMVEKVDDALAQVEAHLQRLALHRVLLDLRQLIGVLTGYDRSRSIELLIRRLGHARCALLIDPAHYAGADHADALAQGMTARVFADEDAAIRWLLEDMPPPGAKLSSD